MPLLIAIRRDQECPARLPIKRENVCAVSNSHRFAIPLHCRMDAPCRGVGEDITEKDAWGKRMFRFGAGKARPILGIFEINIAIPKVYKSTRQPCDLFFPAGVVDSNGHLLIPKRTLANLKETIEFTTDAMNISDTVAITLGATGSGTLQLHDGRNPSLIDQRRESKRAISPANKAPGAIRYRPRNSTRSFYIWGDASSSLSRT